MRIVYLVAVTIPLSSISEGCGKDQEMAFPKRKWQAYDPIPWNDITNGQWVENPESTKLISNALAAHRSALHVIDQAIGQTVDDGATWDKTFTVEPGVNAEILTLPMNRIITGAGRRLRVWVLASRLDSASSAFIWVSAGRNWDKQYLTAAAGTYEWIRLTVDIDQVITPTLLNDLSIQISCGVDWDYGEGNQEEIYIRSIGKWEPARERTRPWIDTSGANNKLTETDYPFSVAMERIINAKVNAAFGYRVPQNNIFQCCFRTSRKTLSGSYGANEWDLGRWMIRKAQGVTQINTLVHGNNPNPITVKVGLWSYDSITYQAQTVNYVAGDIVRGLTSGAWAIILRDVDAGVTGSLMITCPENGPFQAGETIVGDIQGSATINAPSAGPALVDSDEVVSGFATETYWETFTFNTYLVATDAEYEVRVDAKDPGSATTADLDAFYFDEDLDADVAFDEPNTVHTELDDDVRALTLRKTKDMTDHVWSRQRQIILTDRRLADGDTGQIVGKNQRNLVSAIPTGPAHYHPFLWGILNQTPKASRRVRFEFWVSKPNLASVYTVDLGGLVGVPLVGDTATGATSGVTATVLNVDGGVPNATMGDSPVDFILGETINFAPSGASGTVTRTRYWLDIETGLTVRLNKGGAGAYENLREIEIDTSDLGWDRVKKLEVTIPLGPTFEADKTFYGSAGGLWPVHVHVFGWTDNLADYLILHKAICFEEIRPPGGTDMSGEDFDR